MKLIIQIPCFNEEKTLPLVLKDMPKKIPGIDVIELQIIDDGSTDKTVEVAENLGVHYIISHISNRGLGNAFKTGIENALKNGVDILVNTDGDNQYNSADIPRLVKPVLEGKADIVIGNRRTKSIKHFSIIKKFFQWLGTRVLSFLVGQKMKDAVSGFRAYSRQSLFQINVTSDFSYVLDTTIQAAKKHLKIKHISIKVNDPTRPSRLFKSIWQHIKKSMVNMFRVYTMYEPLKIFAGIGIFFLIIGVYPIGRFIYFYFNDNGFGHVQSLVIGTMCVVIGIQFFGLGIIGDILAKQRVLIEDMMKRIKKIQYK